MSLAWQSVTAKRDGLRRLFFVLMCCLSCHFVGADDSVGPVGNGTVIVRAGRVARPYGWFVGGYSVKLLP